LERIAVADFRKFAAMVAASDWKKASAARHHLIEKVTLVAAAAAAAAAAPLQLEPAVDLPLLLVALKFVEL